MGLDMMLKASRHASKYRDKDLMDRVLELTSVTRYSESIDVSVEVLYWRKANAIHGWFVDNVQQGADDCRDTHVTRDKLAQLRDLCAETLVTRDSDLLAPRGGFFFGSAAVDEYYWEDIERTRDELTKILQDPDLKNWDFYYCSSW